MDNEELDGLVVEACCAEALGRLNATDDEDEQERIIADAEATASGINNQGREAQIAFLRGEG